MLVGLRSQEFGESEQDPCQDGNDSLNRQITRIVKKRLADMAGNCKLVEQLMCQQELHTATGLQIMKDCLNRGQQERLSLVAFLNQNMAKGSVPEFDTQSAESFGQRAAYRTHVRSPWVRPTRRARISRGELQGFHTIQTLQNLN